MTPWKPAPLIAALLASSLSTLGAAGLAHVIRARAARVSHALPAAGRQLLDPAQVTPALIKQGSELFLNSCAHCHGADARGDEGPDLHDLEVSDRRIATVITHGIEGEMPSFAKKHGREDIVAIIAYLRTLK
ncbi:MAG TPA: c-type cytochrome [Lacunisphaera sp.]|nr:c-type cytochrome [Lacunisphaera sp.]